MDDRIDILVIGAGPSGLSAALQCKKESPEKSVVLIDKAPRPGGGNFSGAVLDTHCLELIDPHWQSSKHPFLQTVKDNIVKVDKLSLLTSRGRLPIAHGLIPSNMNHLGDSLISVGDMCCWLSDLCISLGVEVYHGFSVDKLLIKEGQVKGVKLKDQGRNRQGKPGAHFQKGEVIESPLTIIADGSLGLLSRSAIEKLGLQQSFNPQVYSLGMKQVLLLDQPRLTPGSVHYFLGYPNRFKQFGGGFLYSLSEDRAAIGLITGIDYPYSDYNPQQELELLKEHPFIQKTLGPFQVIAAGANTIPEGGYYSLPEPAAPGMLLVGDSGGFVDVSRFKGIHLAVQSGIAAGKSSGDILKNEGQEKEIYQRELERSGIYNQLYRARNFRQVFSVKGGLFPGAILSLFQHRFRKQWVLKPDRQEGWAPRKKTRKTVEFQRDRFTALSSTRHREDQPSHIRLKDPAICERCYREYQAPCRFFCPGQVYEILGKGEMELNPANCLHDCSCLKRCPFDNIEWNVPEGGEGPDYLKM